MKIIKPLTLGVLHRPYRFRGRHRLAVAALGFFPLGQGAQERLLTDNLQWAKLVPDLPPEIPLDQILPKGRAEVLLSGSAHALGRPVPGMEVRLQCGAIDKCLAVSGPRRWRRTLGTWLCIDAAQPFQEMPLTWANAYGGSGHITNPLGRGYLPGLGRLRTRAGDMPTVAYPTQSPKPGPRAYLPAGFAPMSLLHSSARLHSGTYDQRWLDEDFPGLPRDFDFGVFNLAPADQQFNGPFRGDESYALTGLHRIQPRLAGKLPGLRARAFILRQGQQPETAEEVVLNCDTVWFFPEHDLGMLVWRGESEIADSDALDVECLMVGYERSDDTARPLEHYRSVMAQRLDPNTGALHAFNEGQLAPPRSPEQIAARAAARLAAAAAQRAHDQALLDEHMQAFRQRSGLTPAPDELPPQVPMPLLQGPSPDEIAAGEFDLAELQAQAQALVAEVQRDSAAQIAAAKDMVAQHDTTAGADPSLATITRQALERAQAAVPDLHTGASVGKPGTADSASLAALGRAARNAALTPTPAVLPDATALALRRFVAQCLRDGTSLAGRDLAGAYLRDMDLRGLDLREVQLERADLRNARLSGTNLNKAVLTGADLCNTDLSLSNLDGANLCATLAHGARFEQASLKGARAIDADWSGADLRGIRCEDFLAGGIRLSEACLDDSSLMRCMLNHAQAAASSWRHTRWFGCVAAGIDLGNANMAHAVMERSALMDAILSGSCWQSAQLSGVFLGGKTDANAVDFSAIQIKRSNLRGARLKGADLNRSIITQSDLSETDLSDARLTEARFYRSRFMGGRLRRSDARKADFFQAMCRKADFSDAHLDAANLLQADLSETVWQGAQLVGARLPQKASLK